MLRWHTFPPPTEATPAQPALPQSEASRLRRLEKQFAQDHYEDLPGETDFTIQERYRRRFPGRLVPSSIYRCLAEMWIGEEQSPAEQALVPPPSSSFSKVPVYRSPAGYATTVRVHRDDPFEGSGLDPLNRYGVEYEADTDRVLYACCGQEESAKGCWVRLDNAGGAGIVQPYRVASSHNYWELLANYESIDALLADDVRTGTAFVDPAYYQRLDAQIRATWINNVYPELLLLLKSLVIRMDNGEPISTAVPLASKSWTKSVRTLYEMIYRFNAPQSGASLLLPSIETLVNTNLLQLSSAAPYFVAEARAFVILESGEKVKIVPPRLNPTATSREEERIMFSKLPAGFLNNVGQWYVRYYRLVDRYNGYLDFYKNRLASIEFPFPLKADFEFHLETLSTITQQLPSMFLRFIRENNDDPDAMLPLVQEIQDGDDVAHELNELSIELDRVHDVDLLRGNYVLNKIRNTPGLAATAAPAKGPRTIRDWVRRLREVRLDDEGRMLLRIFSEALATYDAFVERNRRDAFMLGLANASKNEYAVNVLTEESKQHDAEWIRHVKTMKQLQVQYMEDVMIRFVEPVPAEPAQVQPGPKKTQTPAPPASEFVTLLRQSTPARARDIVAGMVALNLIEDPLLFALGVIENNNNQGGLDLSLLLELGDDVVAGLRGLGLVIE